MNSIIKYSVTILFLSLFPSASAQNNPQLLNEYSEHLINPENFYVLSEDIILFNDPGNREYPLYLIDIHSGNVLNEIRGGRGPGELGGMYKTVTFTENGEIGVFDRELFRMNMYDEELNFIRDIRLRSFNKNIMQAGFLSSNVFFIVPSSDNFIEYYGMEEYPPDASNNLLSIKHESSDFFLPLQNFLLKQDFHFSQDDNELYTAFEYSSLLLKLNKEGIVFDRIEPDFHLFPDEKPESGGVYSLPDVADYPVCALDLDVDDKYVYVLYSGEKLSANFFSEIFNPDKEIEKIVHSDKINVYDKKTGKYTGSYRIPVQAKSFKITEKHLYALSTLENGHPTLYKYKKNILSDAEIESR